MKTKAPRPLDAHIQTKHGCGELSIDEIVKICARRKVEPGICDRVSGTGSPINSEQKFGRYVGILKKYKVKKSAEFDIGCGLHVSAELLEGLDYVVRGLHHFKERPGGEFVSFTDGKAAAPDLDFFRDWALHQFARTIEGGTVDIVAHPTLVPACLQDRAGEVFTDEWKADLLALAATNDVAFEISNRFSDPDEEFVTECLKRGICLALGSGGRTADEVGVLTYPGGLVARLEIPEVLVYPNNEPGFDDF